MWSKRNVGLTEQPIAAGRRRPAGLAEIERATADGRWAAACAGQASTTVPDDLAAALAANTAASAMFATLNVANRFAMLARGETIHPQEPGWEGRPGPSRLSPGGVVVVDTRTGSLGQMNRSTISETKNNLSALLDRVRAGESITILDRDRPIARLVPVRDADDAHLTEPARRGLVRCGPGADLSTIVGVPGPSPRGGDVLSALLAERDEGP